MRAVNLCAAGEWHSKNGQLSWPLHCRSWPPWIGLLWRTCDSLSFYWFLVWSWLILECVTHLRHANERANAFVSNISHTHTHGICDRAVCFPEMSRSVCVYLCVCVCATVILRCTCARIRSNHLTRLKFKISLERSFAHRSGAVRSFVRSLTVTALPPHMVDDTKSQGKRRHITYKDSAHTQTKNSRTTMRNGAGAKPLANRPFRPHSQLLRNVICFARCNIRAIGHV